MGWASGSRLLSACIQDVELTVPEPYRKALYKRLIMSFEDKDCDTIDECLGDYDLFDEAYYELYPERK